MMQCTVIVLVTHRENNDKYAKKIMIHTRRSKMIEMRYSLPLQLVESFWPRLLHKDDGQSYVFPISSDEYPGIISTGNHGSPILAM